MDVSISAPKMRLWCVLEGMRDVLDDVDDLKQAIKKELSPELDGIAAPDLTLWKINKSSEEALKLTMADLEGENPLDPIDTVRECWTDPPPAKVVHVFIADPLYFLADKFFHSSKPEEDGVRPENISGHAFLDLGKGIPGVQSRIMIRAVYIPTLKFIEKRARSDPRSGVIVSGHPGIVDCKPTLFQAEPAVFYLFDKSGVRELPSIFTGLWDIVSPGTWALVDSNTEVKRPASAILNCRRVFIIAAASPCNNRMEWRKARNQHRICTYCMEPWTLEELAALPYQSLPPKEVPTEDQLQSFYHLYGPSAPDAYHFALQPDEYKETLVNIIDNLTGHAIWKAVWDLQVGDMAIKDWHKVFLVQPSPQDDSLQDNPLQFDVPDRHETMSVSIISRYVMGLLWEAHDAFAGQIFKCAVHSVLSSGEKFQALKMTTEVKGSNTHWKKCAETVELKLQPRRRDLFRDVNLLELDSERYYEPIAGNNQTFDSLIYNNGSDSVVTVFQVTVSHIHGVNEQGLRDIHEVRKKQVSGARLRYIVVMPKQQEVTITVACDFYEAFTKKEASFEMWGMVVDVGPVETVTEVHVVEALDELPRLRPKRVNFLRRYTIRVMAPPKKNPHIVRSGNAGNSSKVASGNAGKQAANTINATPGASGEGERKPSLFPPGSKTPLSLLYERCQKNGWEKPIIETKKSGKNAYTAVVTLRRLNKRTSEMEQVRMEPIPALEKGTVDEVRCVFKADPWGFLGLRLDPAFGLGETLGCDFANNIQLRLVLPPEPRKYWVELSEAHKAAPEHQAWMYMPDPFAAKKLVEERQAKARERKEGEGSGVSLEERMETRVAERAFERAPEVKMAPALREVVESAIKTANALYSSTENAASDNPEADTPLPDIDTETLRKQLQTLGFGLHSIARVTTFLLSPVRSLYLTSLRAMPPLDAALSHLLLTTTESDLPPRMHETSRGSGFITSLHPAEDLKTRWTRERAVREGGWPEAAVRECMQVECVGREWARLVELLGRRLVGADVDAWCACVNAAIVGPVDGETQMMLWREEVDAIASVYPDAVYDEAALMLSVPVTDTQLVIHAVLGGPTHPYPLSQTQEGVLRMPGVYLSAEGVSPLVRLDVLKRVLGAILGGTEEGEEVRRMLKEGEGVLFLVVEMVRSAWDELGGHQQDGMDVDEVMKYLLPPPPPSVSSGKLPEGRATKSGAPATKGKEPTRKVKRHADPRSDQQVREAFDRMRNDPKLDDVLSQRKNLPAWKTRERIVAAVKEHRVVVVVGETGCGKTTQLPQFLLDEMILSGQGKRASILITQPRRVAALGVASRVSTERGGDGSVGYAIRGNTNATNQTKLLFVTTGVALRRLAMDRMLNGVTHVVIDEVHERSVESDFLVLELKELLERNMDIRVVLMSATVNHEVFAEYFGQDVPVIEIPGRTYPVKDFYLEDVVKLIGYRATPVRTGEVRTEEQMREFRRAYLEQGFNEEESLTLEILTRLDRLDYEFIATTVKYIASRAKETTDSILIFVSGVQDIRATIEAIEANPGLRGQVTALPLHANLSVDEQQSVFENTAKRKVVVATNVAETSITIPDIVYVIDSGKVKQTSYDTAMGSSTLTEVWTTKAGARQRRGRAGRTQAGECYKLYTRQQEDDKMVAWPIPEILRVPLDGLALQVKVARPDGDVKEFLGKAIDPPKVEAMDEAWKALLDLGAVDERGRITSLGSYMARYAAARFTTGKVGNSDLLTDLCAYDSFVRLKGSNAALIRAFADNNFISTSTVRDVTSLRRDFHSALALTGFVPFSSLPSDPTLNVHNTNEKLIKAIICGGLWPRVVQMASPKQVFDKVQAGTIERGHEAREYRLYEKGEREFVHPSSVLFDVLGQQKSPFLVYFAKVSTSKVFLRDVTEVPMYGVLLFGGQVTVDHKGGGLVVGGDDAWIRMKAIPRIGVLVNQLRRLLDAQLGHSLESGSLADMAEDNVIMNAILALLDKDGLTM
ncbi:hypothetical protein FRB99_005214 [Tulasnella sp. 403]|nr:hypothetical protein FRB99_005214 [Tulasnella sp. 403]